MPKRCLPPAAPADLTGPNPDVIFATLGDPVRRRLLLALVDGQPRTATQLMPAASRRLSAVLKHLVVLRAADMITADLDPVDNRRQRYHLSPAFPVQKTDSGWEIDFGCCLVRV